MGIQDNNIQDNIDDRIDRYLKAVKQEENLLNDLNKKYTTISICRLVDFVGIVVAVAFGITGHNKMMYVLAAALIICFIALLKYHSVVNEKIGFSNSKKEVLNRYQKRLDGTWGIDEKDKFDTGEELINSEMARDLDLVGKKSLYQLICVASLDKGRKKLAEILNLSELDYEKISKRNEAVRELASKNDYVVDFEVLSTKIKNSKNKKLKKSIEDIANAKVMSSLYKVLMVLMPVVMIVMLVLLVIGIIKYPVIIVAFLLYLIIMGALSKDIEDIVIPIYVFGASSKDYIKLFERIKKEDFDSKLMSELKAKICGNDGITKAMAKLEQISQAYNISYNPVVHMILNGFFGWDLLVAHLADSWNKRYKNSILELEEILAEMEVLNSLSVLSVVRKTTNPALVNNADSGTGISVSMTNIYHPLLDVKTVVSNSATIKDGVTIITGSNMSGKTTFLRTMAINLVIAYAGGEVLADSFEAPLMQIFTSMRVNDDVSNGISTFYAEILRIKKMAEYVKGDNLLPPICFIDEIFKGTNSADRIVGAKQAIAKLAASSNRANNSNARKGIVMVSTHDFELCDLSLGNGDGVVNYHFEEHYDGDKLLFDYKIKDGKCTTRNAMAILKMAGLSD